MEGRREGRGRGKIGEGGGMATYIGLCLPSYTTPPWHTITFHPLPHIIPIYLQWGE